MRPKLVIFDCDGVLIDSEIIACRVTADALTRAGYPISADDIIHHFAGISARSLRDRVEGELGRRLPPDFDADMRTALWAAFADELAPMTGIDAALDRLDIPACVASGSTRERLDYTLGLAGLRDRFAGRIFSAEAVANGKPEPDLFLLVAREMDVHPGECLVIEDSVPGIRAARAAGMPVLGFCGGGHCAPAHAARLLQEGAIAVFSNAATLPRLLA